METFDPATHKKANRPTDDPDEPPCAEMSKSNVEVAGEWVSSLREKMVSGASQAEQIETLEGMRKVLNPMASDADRLRSMVAYRTMIAQQQRAATAAASAGRRM